MTALVRLYGFNGLSCSPVIRPLFSRSVVYSGFELGHKLAQKLLLLNLNKNDSSQVNSKSARIFSYDRIQTFELNCYRQTKLLPKKG